MVQPTNMVHDPKFRVMPGNSKLKLKTTLDIYSINFFQRPTASESFSQEQDRFLIHLGNGEQLKNIRIDWPCNSSTTDATISTYQIVKYIPIDDN